MSDWTSVFLGYSTFLGAVAGYAWWTIARGRRIGRELGIGSSEEADTWT